MQQKLQKNTNLAGKLQSRLPAGTDLNTAAAGFRNLGQFVAAVNVSNNLGLDFTTLKTAMVTDGKSLGQAIQSQKGTTVNATQQAQRAADRCGHDDSLDREERQEEHGNQPAVKTRGLTIGAVTLGAWLFFAAPVVAQGNGNGNAFGHGKTTASAAPGGGNDRYGSAPGGVPPAEITGVRNFAAWLDDASIIEPGSGVMSFSAGYWRMAGFSELDLPSFDVGLGSPGASRPARACPSTMRRARRSGRARPRRLVSECKGPVARAGRRSASAGSAWRWCRWCRC